MHTYDLPARPSLFCFGYGYSCQVLGSSLEAQGWKIYGTHRSTPLLFDGTTPVALPEDITHLLISIPPVNGEDCVLQHHASLFASLPHLTWIGYLSTTGVYGDTGGAWVDETSKTCPPNDRLIARKKAEDAWLSLPLSARIHVFRLSGIYGPGRSALTQVQTGTAKRIDKPNQYFSRIHVEDIAATIAASFTYSGRREIFNVADDLPSSQEEVIRYASELLHVPQPPLVPFEAADLSEMARSFYMSSRRVRNDKIKQELQVRLRYPTYKEGLKALL